MVDPTSSWVPSSSSSSLASSFSTTKSHHPNLTPPSTVMSEHNSHKRGLSPWFSFGGGSGNTVPHHNNASSGLSPPSNEAKATDPESKNYPTPPPIAASEQVLDDATNNNNLRIPPQPRAGHHKPHHHNQFRNLIAALSFDTVFRRSPQSGSSRTGNNDDDVDDDDATSITTAGNNDATAVLKTDGNKNDTNPRKTAGSRPQFLPRHLRDSLHVQTHNVLHGTLDPDGGVEIVFYDCMEYGDDGTPHSDTFQKLDFRRDSVVMESISLRGGALRESIEVKRCATTAAAAAGMAAAMGDDQDNHNNHSSSGLRGGGSGDGNWVDLDMSSRGLPALPPQSPRRGCGSYPAPPPPPDELPLRFLRAGKGNVEEGLRRYKATLEWRARERMDTILREPNWHYPLIKKHYPHFFAGRGKLGEPCFYEQPPKTNLKALKEGGVTLESLLRHVRRLSMYLVRSGSRGRLNLTSISSTLSLSFSYTLTLTTVCYGNRVSVAVFGP